MVHPPFAKAIAIPTVAVFVTLFVLNPSLPHFKYDKPDFKVIVSPHPNLGNKKREPRLRDLCLDRRLPTQWLARQVSPSNKRQSNFLSF